MIDNLFERQLVSIVQKSANVNINAENIKSILIKLPSLKEQKEISDLFLNIDNTITLHHRKLQQLKEVKRGMLLKILNITNHVEPKIRFKFNGNPWKKLKLGEVISIIGGNAWKSSDYVEDGKYLVLTISNVQGDRFINTKTGNWINTERPGKYLLQDGDIVVSLTGNVGRVSLVDNNICVLNQRVAKVIPNNRINRDFLFAIMSDRKFEKTMINLGQGAAQLNINNNDILNYEIYVPELDEQKIIGSFFKKLDRLIELQEREIELLEETNKGFLQKMFV